MIGKILTQDWLLEHAGQKVFDRGMAYYRQGLPEIIRRTDKEILADVEGTENYRVSITLAGQGLSTHCTCPAMRDFGRICKHIVAVGLSALAVPVSDHGTSCPPTQTEQIDAYLKTLTKEDLAAYVMERVLQDKSVRKSLLRRAASANLPEAVSAETLYKSLKSQVTQATRTGGFLEYGDADGWCDEVIQMIGDLERVALGKNPAVLVRLCDYLYERLLAAIDNMDDSDGGMTRILEELNLLYLKACVAAKIPAQAMAEKLFKLRKENWLFELGDGDFDTILGQEGRAHFSRLVRTAYAALPPKKKSRMTGIYMHRDSGEPEGASYIRSMMRDITEKEGSLDEKIAFLAHELDWPGHYRGIADLCLSHDRTEEAGQWLDKGLAVFKGRESQDLPWRRAELHIVLKEYGAAEELAWKTFTQRKDYESWKEVRKLSGKTPDGQHSFSTSALEEKAIDMLSLALKAGKKDDTWTPCDALTRIYLDRDDASNAWAVAESGSVSAPLLIAIAEKIRKMNPDVSIRIHKQMAGTAILPLGRRAYEEAMTHVRKLKDIMDAAQFADYVAGLRRLHKQKKLLMEMLDKI